MTAAISSQFEQNLTSLAGAARMEAARREALERFSHLGLPDRRVESWHYTSLESLAGKNLTYHIQSPTAADVERSRDVLSALRLDDALPRLVFIDGHRSDDLSAFGHANDHEILPLGDAPDSLPIDEDHDTALDALNRAFASEGALIRVGASADQPLQIVFIGCRSHLAPQLRLGIRVAAGARAVVEQWFVDVPGAQDSWLNLVAAIDLAENSQLEMRRLQTHASDRVATSLYRVALDSGAHFSAGSVELGGRLVRNEFLIELGGEQATADVFGLSLSRNSQHLDTRIAVDHVAPHTTSRQQHRAIAADASRCVFNGKVTVREDAQHIDARQRNDNLLLSPKAEIDTKPELEIYADQVVCSHGATVGELDENQLFYLRARGIDAGSARAILTTAFAATVLARFGDSAFSAAAGAAVASSLPGSTPTA